MTERGYRALRAGDPLWSEKLRDQKPPARVKATRAEWAAIRELKLDWCRVCEQTIRTVGLHHLVGRDLGGDDIADNCVPLCGSGTTGCHGLVEHRDPWACSLLGQQLTSAERAYVLAKKGSDFLARYYSLKEERAA